MPIIVKIATNLILEPYESRPIGTSNIELAAATETADKPTIEANAHPKRPACISAKLLKPMEGVLKATSTKVRVTI